FPHEEVPPFPTRRSSDLGLVVVVRVVLPDVVGHARGTEVRAGQPVVDRVLRADHPDVLQTPDPDLVVGQERLDLVEGTREAVDEDRKSTRLNSSHVKISY